ncbi:MAG: hypothetical protein LQ351_004919 [Letrouitia transgressa]|nr:MAG: hypothetical protein LQ351_004919 [Letrouitia transgressa]
MQLSQILSTVTVLIVGSGVALPHDPLKRAALGSEQFDPSINPSSKRQLLEEPREDTSFFNSTQLAEAAANFRGTPVPVPGTRTVILIADLPEHLDASDIETMLIVRVRGQIHAHSLPDKGNQPITPNFRVKESNKIVFSALSLPPFHVSWNILFDTTIALKIFMLDLGHHVACDYVIEHEEAKVGMGSMRKPSFGIAK